MRASRARRDTHADIPAVPNAKGGPRIPVAPFIEWCEMKLVQYGGPDALKAHIDSNGRIVADASGARGELARRLCIAERTLWRYMHHRDSVGRPTTVVPRWPVEDMLARAGGDFYTVYPEFEHERDIEIEPDGWCKACREFVTPIFGLCPWDDTPVDLAKAWAA